MGSTMFEIFLVPGIIALVIVLPSVWWFVSYHLAKEKIIRLWDEGCTEPLAIYTFPFPHVVVMNQGLSERHSMYRTHSMISWVDEDGITRIIPVFGISDEAFQ
jgi:hypothetical protein